MTKQSGTCPKCRGRIEFDPANDGRVVCPHCNTPLSPACRADPLVGQTLGEFEIVEPIGRGGMGAVYRACQSSLRRFVALKILPERFSHDADFLARFDREARAAAAVTHPNIVEVFTIGESRGYRYIAMELVDGEDLGQIVQRNGALPAERVLEMMRQTAAALAKAHAAGIVHRDIKPSNILLTTDGFVKVADFGLAKRSDMDAEVTHTGAALGTPQYMPPEAARGQPFDARGDLYSLGATFYYALAGRAPFEGATTAEVFAKLLETQTPPLREVAPRTPSAMCRVIQRLLEKDPARRYQNARELLQDLQRVATAPAGTLGDLVEALGDTELARSVPPPSRPHTARVPLGARRTPSAIPVARKGEPNWGLIAGVAAGVVLTLGAVIAVIHFASGGTSPSEPAAPDLAQPGVAPPVVAQRPPPGPGPEPGPRETHTRWPFDAAEARRRQAETARALGVGVEQAIDLGNGVKMTLVLIPAGEFLLGHPPTPTVAELAKIYGDSEYPQWLEWERPQHRVRISKPFRLGKLEVTREQWQAVLGGDPGMLTYNPRYPIEQVSWFDCQAFLKKLSERSGRQFRLPTEAQWEYACRAGAASEFYFGESPADLASYEWFNANSGATHQPVGQKKPNAWGLHDMAGNIGEWCEDVHVLYDKAAQTDPVAPETGDHYVTRGGDWRFTARECRSSSRTRAQDAVKWPHLGLRVCVGDQRQP